MALTLGNICRRMGWPEDEEHMAMARDQKLATLYGRLSACRRITEDAHDGIRAFEALRDKYRAQVLGTHGGGSQAGLGVGIDAEAAQRLANEWVLADGALTSAGAAGRATVLMLLDASPDASPSDVSPGVCEAANVGGHALARHFGLRQ